MSRIHVESPQATSQVSLEDVLLHASTQVTALGVREAALGALLLSAELVVLGTLLSFVTTDLTQPALTGWSIAYALAIATVVPAGLLSHHYQPSDVRFQLCCVLLALLLHCGYSVGILVGGPSPGSAAYVVRMTWAFGALEVGIVAFTVWSCREQGWAFGRLQQVRSTRRALQVAPSLLCAVSPLPLALPSPSFGASSLVRSGLRGSFGPLQRHLPWLPLLALPRAHHLHGRNALPPPSSRHPGVRVCLLPPRRRVAAAMADLCLECVLVHCDPRPPTGHAERLAARERCAARHVCPRGLGLGRPHQLVRRLLPHLPGGRLRRPLARSAAHRRARRPGCTVLSPYVPSALPPSPLPRCLSLLALPRSPLPILPRDRALHPVLAHHSRNHPPS